MKKKLHRLVRETGELCRHTWGLFLEELFTEEDGIEDFVASVVHGSIAHWEGPRGWLGFVRLHRSQQGSALSIAEVVSLKKYGTLDRPLPIKTVDADVLENINERLRDADPVFDCYEVVRWATVHFWGLSAGTAGSREATRIALIHEPTEELLNLIDTSVLEGLCTTIGRPSQETSGLITQYMPCDTDDEDDEDEGENETVAPEILH